MIHDQFVSKVIEPIIIYLGSLILLLLQTVKILAVESYVNILVGVGVLLYTILKIVQLINEIRDRNTKNIDKQIDNAIEDFMEEDNEQRG